MRRQRHEHARDARGEEVQNVVQPRGGGAEVAVPLAAVAHHGVHGVDGLVQKAQRRAAEQQVEQRGDDAVGGVLGHGLDRGLRDARLGERAGVPAHDPAHLRPREGQIARRERVVDLHALFFEALRREQLEAPEALEREPRPDAHAPEPAQKKERRDERHGQHQRGQHPARQALARLRRGEDAAQQLFQQRDQLSEQHHGMRQPAGVAEGEIERRAQRGGQQNLHQRPSR
jgi:hypothetical protein